MINKKTISYLAIINHFILFICYIKHFQNRIIRTIGKNYFIVTFSDRNDLWKYSKPLLGI